MTSFGERLRCSQCALRDAERYGNPWAIVYGTGPASEDLANDVARRCRDHRVSTRVRAIDNLGDVELARYSSLVLSLPTLIADRNVVNALGPFVDLVIDYRLRHPVGLDPILAGTLEWFDVGVVQVIGRRALLHHPAMKPALARVCRLHYFEDDDATTIDVLMPFHRLGAGLQPTPGPVGDQHQENMERVWRRVQAWGVSDLADVPRILATIKEVSDYYETQGERYPALYRPNPKVKRNRLEIVLYGPDDVVGDPTAYAASGARVWRHVEKQIKSAIPSFARPAGQDNKKHAAKALRALNLDLLVIDAYLRNTEQ